MQLSSWGYNFGHIEQELLPNIETDASEPFNCSSSTYLQKTLLVPACCCPSLISQIKNFTGAIRVHCVLIGVPPARTLCLLRTASVSKNSTFLSSLEVVMHHICLHHSTFYFDVPTIQNSLPRRVPDLDLIV